MCQVIASRFVGSRPYGVLTVANAIAAALPEGHGGSPRRLHDLVWLVNGWSLVIDEKPLVDEAPRRIVPSDSGPRYATIEQAFENRRFRKGRFVGGLLARPLRASMTLDEQNLVSHVCCRYGRLDADALRNMHFHRESPFMRAYLGDGLYDETAVREHFMALAAAGRGGTRAA